MPTNPYPVESNSRPEEAERVCDSLERELQLHLEKNSKANQLRVT